MVPRRRHLGVWASGAAGRRERRKRQPAALPRLESNDPYGSPREVLRRSSFQRAKSQGPWPLSWPWAEPRAAGPDPRSRPEASPQTRGRPADRAEFQVFAVGSGGEAAPITLLRRRWPSCPQVRTGLNFKFCGAGASGRGSASPTCRTACCPRALPSPTWNPPALSATPAAAPKTPNSPGWLGSIT